MVEMKHLIRPFEIKAIEADTGIFRGYASVFGNVDSYGDVVMPGAFTKFLQDNPVSKVKLLWQHRPSEPIGVYREIREDAIGLYVEGQLAINGVKQAQEAYELLKMGALEGLSIGFTIAPDGMERDNNINYLKAINLWEVSIVTFPANPVANITAVKAADSIKTIRDFERFLRDVGFSQNRSKAIAAEGFKASTGQRDVDSDEAEILTAINTLTHTINEVKNEYRSQRSS